MSRIGRPFAPRETIKLRGKNHDCVHITVLISESSFSMLRNAREVTGKSNHQLIDSLIQSKYGDLNG